MPKRCVLGMVLSHMQNLIDFHSQSRHRMRRIKEDKSTSRSEHSQHGDYRPARLFEVPESLQELGRKLGPRAVTILDTINSHVDTGRNAFILDCVLG
jgi:Flp pilus assembly protein TadB